MLVAYIANPATGGLSGFLDKFRSAGMDGLVQSWLGSATTPQVPSASQLDTVLGTGDGLLNKLATRLGLPYDKVSTAVAALLPMLVSRMTLAARCRMCCPRNSMTLPAKASRCLAWARRRPGRQPQPPRQALAPVAAASGGIGKWLPWLIAALVVILGISYCQGQAARRSARARCRARAGGTSARTSARAGRHPAGDRQLHRSGRGRGAGRDAA
jgi:hypothetical protein